MAAGTATRRAAVCLLQAEARFGGGARCAKGNAERTGQVSGLFQVNRFVARHVFEQRLIRSSDPDCRLIEKHQTLQVDLAHPQIRCNSDKGRYFSNGLLQAGQPKRDERPLISSRSCKARKARTFRVILLK